MEQKSNDVGILISLLNEKYSLLTEILDLTKLQTEAIESEKIDELSSLIEKKQLKINKINEIDEKFSNQFKNIKEKYKITEIGELNVEKKILKELKEITQKVYDITINIYEIEKKNNDSIKGKYEKVKSKLKSIKDGKRAASGYYSKAVKTSGYYIDKKK